MKLVLVKSKLAICCLREIDNSDTLDDFYGYITNTSKLLYTQ